MEIWKEDQKWEEDHKMMSPESKEKEREKVRKEKERKYGGSRSRSGGTSTGLMTKSNDIFLHQENL